MKMHNMMVLFMFTYFVSYVTRVNFTVVIAEIAMGEGLLKSTASLALTGSAMTYAIGQLLSGYFGDKIQPKKMILVGLTATMMMNLLIPICQSAYQMTIVWSVNGLAQAFMWPPLVKLISCVFPEDHRKKAVVMVSWGGAFGTILIYLVAPLCIYLGGWRSVFFLSAFAAMAMAVIWWLKCPELDLDETKKGASRPKVRFPWSCMLIGILIAIVLHGALRDGVTTWMPSLIMETFHLSSNVSILTGVVFPVFSIIVLQIVSGINRRAIQNELTLAGLLFGVAIVSALTLALFPDANAGFTVFMSAILTGSMHGVNLMLICSVPLYYAEYGRISLVSGVCNAFTYLGSGASAYGVAMYTERFGWSGTAYLWSLIALMGGIICLALAKRWGRTFRV